MGKLTCGLIQMRLKGDSSIEMTMRVSKDAVSNVGTTRYDHDFPMQLMRAVAVGLHVVLRVRARTTC